MSVCQKHMKWFAVKSNAILKISLVQGVNWLRTWPISPVEKQWKRPLWEFCPNASLARGDKKKNTYSKKSVSFFFFYKKSCFPWCTLYSAGAFIYWHSSLVSFYLLWNLLCSSSKDRDGKATKDDKGKHFTDTFLKTSLLVIRRWSSISLYVVHVINVRIDWTAKMAFSQASEQTELIWEF